MFFSAAAEHASDGLAKRMDYGCVKIAEHAGFIEQIANSTSGVVETVTLNWDPSI